MPNNTSSSSNKGSGISRFFKWMGRFPLLLNLIAMLLVLVLAFCGLRWWLNSYTHHGESIEVPDLYNTDIAEAMTRIEVLGLHLEVSDSLWVDSIMPGRILKGQMPGAGVNVKKGRTVYVRLRKQHRDKKPIPDLINNSGYRHAKSELEYLGFHVGEPQYQDGWKDYVLGIKLGNRELHTGDLVTEGSTLTLVIGKGIDDDILEEESDSTLIMDGDFIDPDISDDQPTENDD